jgi:hypothetical protein
VILLAAVACAAPQQQQQQQRRPYGPPGPANYPGKAPVYRDEMALGPYREEVPVYRKSQEKPLEKRQAAYGPPASKYVEEKLPPQPFAYEYGVKDDYSGNAFAKTETQNELGQVQGSYKTNLPDGRIQTVTYHADHEGGFVAEVRRTITEQHSANTADGAVCAQVTYEGVAQYPEPPPGGYGPYKVDHPAPAPTASNAVSYYSTPLPQGPGAYPGPGPYTNRR